jgi:uncharacterized protein (TIRG00374 family)
MVRFLKYLFSAGLLVFLATRLDWDMVRASLLKLEWWALPLAVLLHTGAYVFGAIRWRTLLRVTDVNYALSHLLPPYFIGAFFNNILPSSTGGDIYRIYHIHTRQHDIGAAISPVLTDRIIGLATMLLIAVLMYPFYPGNQDEITALARLAGYGLLGLIMLLALIGIAPTYRTIQQWIGRWRWRRPADTLSGIIDTSNQCLKHPLILLNVSLSSVASHVCIVLAFWVLAQGIGATASLLTFLFLVPLVLVVAGMPISVGGLGVREAAAVTLFVLSGMEQANAAAVTLLFIPVVLISGLPGLYFFLTSRSEKTGAQAIQEKPSSPG